MAKPAEEPTLKIRDAILREPMGTPKGIAALLIKAHANLYGSDEKKLSQRVSAEKSKIEKWKPTHRLQPSGGGLVLTQANHETIAVAEFLKVKALVKELGADKVKGLVALLAD